MKISRRSKWLPDQPRSHKFSLRLELFLRSPVSGKDHCASSVTTSGYTIPSSTVVASVIQIEIMKFLFHKFPYASPICVMIKSINLIPINGAIIPPSP